jgi:hypothetical protein
MPAPTADTAEHTAWTPTTVDADVASNAGSSGNSVMQRVLRRLQEGSTNGHQRRPTARSRSTRGAGRRLE